MYPTEMRREVEDVVELMQNIQSRLTVKEAAQTSVLSKSWLHAWSTFPNLRFDVGRGKSMKLVDVERTLVRYHRDNTPIKKFDLKIDIENQESASQAEKWIGHVATKTCLKEISLSLLLWGASFRLPDEILASENLNKIRVSAPRIHPNSVWMTMTNPVIKCVSSLRELHLEGVSISEEALHHILLSCRLLEKIELLHSCEGFKTIKIKNLPRLYELNISFVSLYENSTALEISDVPKLGVFSYYRLDVFQSHFPLVIEPLNSHSISMRKVRRLMLGDVITDNTCLDMIKSGFPFLVSLTLGLTYWKLGTFHFTSSSIKRLVLHSCPHTLIDLQVHAPKLLIFDLSGETLPSLSFPVSSLKQLRVSLGIERLVDASFFLNMREALSLSHKCDLDIQFNSPLDVNIDIDDLRTRLMFPPATNVQELRFQTTEDECMWEQSPFFDAFFEICHPKCVYAKPDDHFNHNNHFCRLMLREVLEKKTTTTGIVYWPHYLKHVQIKQPLDQKWETLTNSHRSFLDGSTPDVYLYFNLNWC
ncbi:putative F-box/LRR-repeat protein At3g28410 isoform X2 [Lactuca sativa]|uniref:putative F-box/LRR-repeat protein At3g28410 isoform X2 n=1 Tax=Lactuca sativa TaxID=4236 RepID=UPI001C693ADF|nr:putative F-box/LRR-repeat protein At3g28410 isoform X2 [Lactuca sativa]XP_042753920.1 putative F-box/LRR-repeat protein At3g28410 isoform X2 [Lactuca sativa]